MGSPPHLVGLAAAEPFGVRPLSRRLNFSWAFAGNLVYAAAQWAVLVALVKLGTVQMVGQYALVLALTAPVITFTNLNLRAAQATDARREYQFRDYLELRILSLVAAAILITLLALAYGFDGPTLLLTLMVTLTRTFDSLSDLVYGLMQQHEKLDRVGISRILQGSLQAFGLIGAFYWTGSLVVGTAVAATACALVTLFYDVPGARLMLCLTEHEKGADSSLCRSMMHHTSAVRRLAVLTLPLGVAAILDSLSVNIPRYYLESYGGRATLGYFAALSSFLVLEGLVISSLVDAVRPSLARHFNRDLVAFRSLFIRLILATTAVGVAGVVAAAMVGDRVLLLAFTREYAAQSEVLVWIMITALLWGLAGCVSSAVNATRRFRGLAVIFLATTAVTVVCSAVLIPSYGLNGGAWALSAGMATRLAGSAFILAHVLRERSHHAARWEGSPA